MGECEKYCLLETTIKFLVSTQNMLARLAKVWVLFSLKIELAFWNSLVFLPGNYVLWNTYVFFGNKLI